MRVTSAVFLLTVAGIAQATRHVPAVFPTIQSAVNAANPSDIVLVAPGTYVENLVIQKPVTVRSSGGAAVTTIDGGGAGRVVVLEQLGKLEGFTVTNGFLPQLLELGAGITCTDGIIRECVVTGNGGPGVAGGGVALLGGVLIDSTVSNNSGWNGGGVWAAAGVTARCTISMNVAADFIGIPFSVSGKGGGLLVSGQPTTIVRDCVIEGNVAPAGGGVLISQAFGGLVHLLRCRVTGNRAVGGLAPAKGGGIFGDQHPANTLLESCLVAGNVAGIGGGLQLTDHGATIRHCTIADNTAPTGPGVHLEPAPLLLQTVTVDNSVIWGQTPSIVNSGALLTISHTDVMGGGGGGTNLNVDPLFFSPASGDYRLTAGSPCLDAADLAQVVSGDLDFDGDPRTFGGLPDMGADEFYGLGPCAGSRVGRGAGGPFDVLLVNGCAGLPDRRVLLPVGAPFVFDVLQPPSNPCPALFIISGFVGIPGVGHQTLLPFGLGTLCIPSTLITPTYPGAFLLTSSYGPVPGMLTASSPAPWSLTATGAPFPFTITFQGLMNESPAAPRLTNGVAVEWR